MKVLIIFLSLVVMGCVTANTRDLSAINPEPAEKGFILPSPLILVDDYSDCMDDCTERGGSSEGCDERCEYGESWLSFPSDHENKKPLKVAGYDECVQACEADGWDTDGCRSACK